MQTFEHEAFIVVFLVDIAGYDRHLEDLGTNEMMDAMTLFQFVANSPTCSSTSPAVLFSNSGLFRSKAERSPVEDSFPDYTGGPNFEKAVEYFTSRFRGLYRGSMDFSTRSVEPEDDRLARQLRSLVDNKLIGEFLSSKFF